MKLEVTEKDIMLLKVVISAFIAFMMLRFVIMPSLDTFKEKEFSLEEASLVADEMQASIDGIGILEKNVAAKVSALKESSLNYYNYMENRQMDELVTGIMLDNNLFPISLAIIEAKPQMLNPYRVQTEKQSTEGTNNFIYIGEVQMVLEGKKVDVWNMLDDIDENYPALRVSFLDMNEKTYMNDQLQTVEQLEITCNIEIYMHKNIDEMTATSAEE